ncbi:hypothetical protein ACLQ24_06815 [Micromonospora sp. DT4]|uniref:hypothetical protein n=1 Tax=Micromonospora sp. DT4 TaxID=3393438 RepID=UPI003CE7121A
MQDRWGQGVASSSRGWKVRRYVDGLVRDRLGDYALAWYVAGALSIGAAGLSLLLRRRPGRPVPEAVLVAATAPRAGSFRG